MDQFCSRCGAENLPQARHCGDCGALLEGLHDSHLEQDTPASERSAPGARCGHCGAATLNEARCPVCRFLQPLPPDANDPYFLMLLSGYPLLLRSPKISTHDLPYRDQVTGLIPPLLAVSIAMPLAWAIALIPQGTPQWLQAGYPALEFTGVLLVLLGVFVLGPPVFLGYAALWQGIALVLGGAGTLERTTRSLGLLWMPTLFLLGGWGFYLHAFQATLPTLGRILNHPEHATSPFWPLFVILPIFCFWGLVLTGVVAWIYQAIILAAANWLELGRVLAIHLVLLAVGVGWYALHQWRFG